MGCQTYPAHRPQGMDSAVIMGERRMLVEILGWGRCGNTAAHAAEQLPAAALPVDERVKVKVLDAAPVEWSCKTDSSRASPALSGAPRQPR